MTTFVLVYVGLIVALIAVPAVMLFRVTHPPGTSVKARAGAVMEYEVTYQDDQGRLSRQTVAAGTAAGAFLAMTRTVDRLMEGGYEIIKVDGPRPRETRIQ